MAPGNTSVDGPDGGGNVMAAIDGEGSDRRLVVADLETEDAWISMAAAGARPLAEWA